jgi:hypothetical protein
MATDVVGKSFKVGQKVSIIRLELIRRPFAEGFATIIEPLDATRDLYRVRFAGERDSRTRIVHSGRLWQRNSGHLLNQLIMDWRASLEPELLADPLPHTSQQRHR